MRWYLNSKLAEVRKGGAGTDEAQSPMNGTKRFLSFPIYPKGPYRYNGCNLATRHAYRMRTMQLLLLLLHRDYATTATAVETVDAR